ncbi:cationic amino acid transporter [Listeria floridensis FSL S10-1187]|uniref:Cationic amino acid transporter n=1 Tax=Listeria floridensis FSL S10-1187 TaxID=1265817 RepID=A0ABN0RGS7_9LIST|nr:APC family permease [Listeria floridensis]EUJ33162.1 cationic amino acid transporter [Listeria floridensis FSL S10-1187]
MATQKESEKSKFSLSGATLYGINAVIGSGIFLLPRTLYEGLGPASLVAMLVDVILVLLLALCFAEVAGYFDKNGGAFQYSKAAFGDFVGFNVGVLGWAVTVIAWGAMAAGFARLFIALVPSFKPYETWIAVILIVLLSVINSFGVKTSKIFTITITIAKLIPIIAFVAISVFFIRGGFDAGNFTPFVQLPPGKSFMEGMSSSALVVFYAFIGFEALPVVAGEMRNPKKNVPKAIVMSIIIVSLLYFLIIAGTIAQLGNGILSTDTPVQDAFTKIIGPVGKFIITIGALISVGGLNTGDSMMIPRYACSIAEDGLLPKAFAKKNKNQAPIFAIIVSGVLASALVLSGSFEQLAQLSVLMRFIQYIPTALSVIALRKKGLEDPGFKLPFGPVIAILSVLVSLWMISSSSMINILFTVGAICITSILYFILYGKKKSEGSREL